MGTWGCFDVSRLHSVISNDIIRYSYYLPIIYTRLDLPSYPHTHIISTCSCSYITSAYITLYYIIVPFIPINIQFIVSLLLSWLYKSIPKGIIRLSLHWSADFPIKTSNGSRCSSLFRWSIYIYMYIYIIICIQISQLYPLQLYTHYALGGSCHLSE